jgi:tetratricopeptide (TPR) repeat protein
MQNKIDRLILNANREFSDNRNVISALVDYSRTLDLFDFLEKSYKIQIHETIVRIAICYDILGNFNKTLDYLTLALKIVPNVASLILYKAVLLQTVGQHTEAQNCLLKYKQMKVKNELELFETFRIVFLFSMQLEKDVLLREINDFTEKHKKNTVILYLRAMIYLDLSNQKSNTEKKTVFLQKYEDDINEAMNIDRTDTEFLLKDKITNENLTKLFFMIVSEMDYYQPKPLVNYSTFHTGFKLFYTLFRIVKIFKVKIVKKKLKAYYKLKIKNIKNQNFNNTEHSNSISHINDSSFSIGNNTQSLNPNYKNNQVITLTENTSTHI